MTEDRLRTLDLGRSLWEVIAEQEARRESAVEAKTKTDGK
jgi:hypothetical protein